MGSENIFPPKTEIDRYIEMLEDHKPPVTEADELLLEIFDNFEHHRGFYLTYDRLRNYLISKKLINERGDVLP